MKVKPNPYIITFSDDADGGPEHVAHLFKEFNVKFKLRNEVVAEGEIVDVEHDLVIYNKRCECCDQLILGNQQVIIMGEEFDEIEYQ